MIHPMNESPLKVDRPSLTVHCDYLVIGSGAGGSVAARELALAGKDVVVVEEGPYLPLEQFRGPVGSLTRKLYRSGGVTPFFGSPSVAFAEARCVGGGTTINGGLLWRTPAWILEEWGRIHGLTLYSEQVLKPHFVTIERLLGVRSTVHVEGNEDSKLLARAARSLGWKVSAARRALGNCQNTNRCPTGCPTGAKRSVALTYLVEAQEHGARLMPNVRVCSLTHEAGRITGATGLFNGNRVNFIADRYFLAAGPIQTPHLLKRSRVRSSAGNQLRFHINLKFVARFSSPIRADVGTIFTEQVQEFEKQGLYMMASNCLPHYVAATLSHQSRQEVESVLTDFANVGLFVAQVRARAGGRIYSPFDTPIVMQSIPSEDLLRIGFALKRMGELLFKAGAVKIYLPLRGELGVTSSLELQGVLDRMVPQRLELITVHAMSSCPMAASPDRGTVDEYGKVWNHSNLWICDSSTLPDNIGESPQGTIMAVAHEILRQHVSQH
jgi:choline dehydrogenase-like flavoprotein